MCHVGADFWLGGWSPGQASLNHVGVLTIMAPSQLLEEMALPGSSQLAPKHAQVVHAVISAVGAAGLQ
ncbi:hypothetical protein DHEL01_v208741 [Diaporthe helianthi]|uniref:Uncharacterized protein n=1 Tax=Diaporthe helianthi TaxID=158607 RepID=A0A2P5HRK9_DIAHE|nr:hypothetical protein DHEL01_v208741 [Diaporthe helianthi]